MLEALRQIAREAGLEILKHYGTVVSTAKSDDSPLTAADLAAHRWIVGALSRLTPDIPVVSEESDPALFTHAGANREFWLVDPLDGTKEFLKQSGEFTVNIGLIREGRPVMGVVDAPAIGLSYWAESGKGAFRLRKGGSPEVIRCRRADPRLPTLVASRDHAGPEVKALLDRFPGAPSASMGSSLKFCLVAAGEADVYLRDLPTSEWDTAAAHCVLECAGGCVMQLDGAPFVYGKPGLRNPGFVALGDPSLRWQGPG